METISVAINDGPDLLCFDLYLINTFAKSTKAERCTDVMFKLSLYCLSVIAEDINSYQRYKDINILDTRYFVVLDSALTIKRLGGVNLRPPPCGFSKNVSSKERVKPWCFVTFNIISHIFSENFIEIPQVVQKI